MDNTNGPTAVGQGAVVVGVNGGLASCRLALVLAAHEARMRNTAIRLVHGCKPLSTLTERQPAIPLVARERQARRQLRDAAEALRPLLDPGTAIEFRIDPRTGIDTLLDQSVTAELLVLQRRDLTRLGRITAGSTSRAVAARARCPVAVTRTGQGSSQGRGAVLVGIDDLPSALRALPLAFAEAAARRARLTPIRMSTIGDSGGGSLFRTTRATAKALELAESLSNTLDRVAAQFPDVVVDDLTLAEDAVAILREVSTSAELLVIGPFAVHERDRLTLGFRARQLIDTAHCPVLVTGPARTGTGNGQTPDDAHPHLGQRSATSSPC